MKLTDNEIRDIVKLLEADKPLPDKFRFLLFEDKREVELVWNGKSSEVCNIVLPFQVIEQVDEPCEEGAPRLVGSDAANGAAPVNSIVKCTKEIKTWLFQIIRV